MSTAELKISIINRITKLEDESIVEQIKRLLDFELEENIYHLSDMQKASVAEAENEYKKGEILSEEQANAEIEKWLKEK